MLQNVNTHKACFCYKDDPGQAVELKEFVYGKIGVTHLVSHTIIFVTKGSIHISTQANESLRLEQGEFIFLPTGTQMSYKASANSTMLLVRLIKELPECHVFRINRLAGHLADGIEGIHVLTVNEPLKYFLTSLLGTQRDGLKCKIYVQLEVARLIFLLHAYYTQEEYIRFFSSVISFDVKFSDFIRQNFVQYRTVNELADALNMSTQQFAKRFRKVFGTTPRQWLQNERAQLIYRDICKSSKTLKEIAFEYDFSQSNFIRYCRQNFSSSPGAIRESLRVDSNRTCRIHRSEEKQSDNQANHVA